jgi:hypothetical protein
MGNFSTPGRKYDKIYDLGFRWWLSRSDTNRQNPWKKELVSWISAQTMYAHVSKCKNDKIKGEKNLENKKIS